MKPLATAAVSALAALSALALLAAGCGKASRSTAPVGDTGGTHLLVFRTNRLSGTSEYDVLLYDLDQGGYRSVSGLNSTFDQNEPCISDDGNLIASSSNRSNSLGGYDIFIYDRGGSPPGTIATHSLNSLANETNPRFTYDSVRMAFVRDSSGVKRVRLYEPTGDTLIALPGLASNGPFDDTAPAPDLHGNRIAFQSNRSGRWHVYVWDRIAGTLSFTGLVGDSDDVEPALSSNGRWLAWSSNRSGGSGGYDVYEEDLVADTLVTLPGANTAGDERHPSVSADGSMVFFQSKAPSATTWSLWEYPRLTSVRRMPALPDTTHDDQQPYVRWQ